MAIKEDSEGLYIHKLDTKKKVIRQEYWVGITGDSYRCDTIYVCELHPALRLIQKTNLQEIDSSWSKVEKTK